MSPGLQRRHCLALAAAALAGPALAAKPVAKFARVFGTRIRYHELGRLRPGRPTLVLLHGLGGTGMGDWGRVAPLLAETHHVIAVDQLGFGESDKPFVTYSIQLWVDVLRYAEGIPGATLVVIPNVGHVTMVEAPEAFMAAVKPFLLP